MTKRSESLIRTIGVSVGIIAFIFGALEAYVSNKYQTKENHVLATNAAMELGSFKKDVEIKLQEMQRTMYNMEIEIKVLQERVSKLHT